MTKRKFYNNYCSGGKKIQSKTLPNESLGTLTQPYNQWNVKTFPYIKTSLDLCELTGNLIKAMCPSTYLGEPLALFSLSLRAKTDKKLGLLS